jgi:hypothetical protein
MMLAILERPAREVNQWRSGFGMTIDLCRRLPFR